MKYTLAICIITLVSTLAHSESSINYDKDYCPLIKQRQTSPSKRTQKKINNVLNDLEKVVNNDDIQNNEIYVSLKKFKGISSDQIIDIAK